MRRPRTHVRRSKESEWRGRMTINSSSSSSSSSSRRRRRRRRNM